MASVFSMQSSAQTVFSIRWCGTYGPQMAPHQRLLAISNEVEETIKLHRPDVVAIERVFAQDNVRSVMSTAQVVGIVSLAAAKASLPIGMHSPSEVKAAVTGNGRAQKFKCR